MIFRVNSDSNAAVIAEIVQQVKARGKFIDDYEITGIPIVLFQYRIYTTVYTTNILICSGSKEVL